MTLTKVKKLKYIIFKICNLYIMDINNIKNNKVKLTEESTLLTFTKVKRLIENQKQSFLVITLNCYAKQKYESDSKQSN